MAVEGKESRVRFHCGYGDEAIGETDRYAFATQ